MIDASVAQAAGEIDASSVTAIRCRDFLLAILETSHRLVMTPAIEAEWNNHQSRFARRWRRTMTAKKRVAVATPPRDEAIRHALQGLLLPAREQAALEKDLLLVEAALVTDRTIASRDEVVRRLLQVAAASIRALKPIIWVNPEIEEEQAITWIAQGARFESRRQLGYQG